MSTPSSSDLANVRAPLDSRVRPGAPFVYGNERLAGTTGTCDVPVVLQTPPNAGVLNREPAQPARQACYGATYGYGQTPWFDNYSGAHGIIAEAPPVPGQVGGQEPWRSWNPRTFRNEPTVPWDEGVYQ